MTKQIISNETRKQLIYLKDDCWTTENEVDRDKIKTYKERVEALDKKGYNVDLFLTIATQLERRQKNK